MPAWPELTQHVRDALMCRAAGEDDPGTVGRLTRAVDGIFDHGEAGVWSAEVAFANAYLLGQAPPLPGELWAVEAEDLRTSRTVNSDAAVTDADSWGVVNAMRFIVAVRNGDLGGARAIHSSAPDAEAAGALFSAILDLTAIRVRTLAELARRQQTASNN